MKLTHQFALLLAALLVLSGAGGAFLLVTLDRADAAQAWAAEDASEIVFSANALDRSVREEMSLVLGFMRGSAPRENIERTREEFNKTLAGMRVHDEHEHGLAGEINEVLGWLEAAEADLLVVGSLRGQGDLLDIVEASRATEAALTQAHTSRSTEFRDLMQRSWNDSERQALERARTHNTEARAPFLMYAPALATDRLAASIYAMTATSELDHATNELADLGAGRARGLAEISGDESTTSFAQDLATGQRTPAQLQTWAAAANASPFMKGSGIAELLSLAASTRAARDQSAAYFEATLALQRHMGKLLAEGLLQLDLLTAEILKLTAAQAHRLLDDAAAHQERVRIIVAMTVAGAALPVGLVGALAVLRLRKRLREFDAAAAAVSAGRFDSAPSMDRRDDFDKLAQAWHRMLDGLRQRDSEISEKRAISLQNERMAALGSLLAGVAHEVNNPLAFIKSNEEMSMQDVDDVLADPNVTLTTSARGLLQGVRASLLANTDGIGRVEKINRALKGFGGPAREAREFVDLNDVAEGVLIIAHNRLKNKHRIARAFAPLPMIHGSPQELGQVVLNLVINAAEASPAGGTIRVETVTDSGKVRLTVSDDGPGVDMAMRDRLFQRFATSKPSGTGLGLHISRNIAVAHGGTLDLEPSPKGALFALTIPAARAAASPFSPVTT